MSPRTGRLPRSFYATGVCAGFAYATLALGLPLYVLAVGHSASLAGGLLALETIGFSFGALLAAPLVRRTGPWNVLAAGLGAVGVGHVAILLDGTMPVGPLIHGVGMGLFWVGAQALLGRRSGDPGSERAFVRQYVLYVVGTAAGSASAGLAIAAARLAGLDHADSIRVSFGLGALAALAGLAALALSKHRRAWKRSAPPPRRRRRDLLPLHGFAEQSPDLLLVAGMAFVLNLSPVVLKSSFGFSPLAIGLVFGGVAAAKIAGSLAAAWIARAGGRRAALLGMLAAAAILSLLLAPVHVAPLFVALLLAITLLGLGGWPLIVDACVARVEPAHRDGFAVAWNVREYFVIAAATATSGWLLHAFHRPALLFLIAAACLAGSAATAAAVLRRPVFAPQAA